MSRAARRIAFNCSEMLDIPSDIEMTCKRAASISCINVVANVSRPLLFIDRSNYNNKPPQGDLRG
jgi:hypothetical protein